MASTFPAGQNDGTPAFVRDLAQQEAIDFDVLILTPRVRGTAAEEQLGDIRVRRFGYFPRRWEDLADGAIIENLRSRRSRWLQVLPFLVGEAVALRRALREFEPDVMHVHWIIPQGVVARIAAPRVPWVLTTLGGDLYALRGGLLRRMKAWTVRHANTVTVMNAEMSGIVDSLGSRRTIISPMGADLAGVRAIAEARAPSSSGDLRLLFVGRLVEKKGLSVLLEAIRGISDGVSLTVVGDGPLRESMERLARGLPVTFVGQLGRSDLHAAYATHEVTVTPSVHAVSGDKDGLPVALLEAMGSGSAIIASRLPGIDEAIEDGVSGLLVESGDAAALSEAIMRMTADRELLARLGRAAAARAEEFSVERVGECYRTLLLEASRTGRP